MRPYAAIRGHTRTCPRRALLLRNLTSPRPHLFVAVLLLALASVVGVAPLRPAPVDARTLPVPGNRLTLPTGAHVLGALPATRPLRLVVGLAPRHADLLAAFLALRGSSPTAHTAHTRRALTPAQFADLFSPTVAAQATVTSYLRSYRLRIVRTYPDRLLIDVTGEAQQLAAAFNVALVRYRDRHGLVHYANATAPRLPAAVAPLVSTIVGLRDDAAPRHLPRPRLASRFPRVLPRVPTVPPSGMLTPAQLQMAYDITPVYNQVFAASGGVSLTAPITGAGQTVALYELSPFNPADIAAYDAAFGITSAAPISIAVDGGATNPFGGAGTAEAAMDVELIQAIAPGAQILVYNGPASPSSTDNTGADDTYARIVNDNRAAVLSTSWGQCEPDQQADNPPDLTLLHTLFAQAIAEGMTVVAASGDGGANDCTDGRPNPSVDYPASDPYVIGVGGTNLSSDDAGHVITETGWANSGGGPSAVWPRPAWQTGRGVPPGPMREVPDLALNAGQRYAVWVQGGWSGVGGTSAGPPVWAAILALANQSRYVAAAAQGAPAALPCAMAPGFGDVHAALYQLGATLGPSPAFRDITSGPGSAAATPGPGWDAATGWGVPDAYAFLRALIAMPAFAPPAPGPCPSATVTAAPTTTATAAPSATVVPLSTPSTTVAPPTVTPGGRGTPTPIAPGTRSTSTPTAPRGPRPRPAMGLGVYIVPGQIRVGGVIALEVRRASGRGQSVTFEVRYPGQRPQRMRGATDRYGAATLYVRVLRTLPHNHALVASVRVTVQAGRRTTVRWTRFRILPAATMRSLSHTQRPAPAPGPLCWIPRQPGAMRGSMLCRAV